jgi:hypothetical protein
VGVVPAFPGKGPVSTDDITEDQVDELPLDDILRIDAMDLAEQLQTRLAGLPYLPYLACIGSVLVDLRTFFG